MILLDIHERIEACRLETKAPVISSVDDGYEVNEQGEDISSLKIGFFFDSLLDSKKYRKNLIYVSEYYEDIYTGNNNSVEEDAYPWIQPNDIIVKAGIISHDLSSDKDIALIKGGKYFLKEVDIEKFKSIVSYGDINLKDHCHVMYLQPFYLHINEEIIVYGHIDYSFGFIDISGKNGDLMKELLKDFIKISGLTWYANDLGKSYIIQNKIPINYRDD